MEEQRQNAYRDPEVERLLVEIIGQKTEIMPLFDLSLGYRYPDVEEKLNKKPEEARKFLEKLADAGILDRKLYEIGIHCPKCSSFNVDTQYACPFCKSIDVRKDALIEHLACGYIDVLTNFKKDTDYACPKCGGKLEQGNYKSVGSWYSCSSCGKRVEFPLPEHKCRSCGAVFNLDSAILDRIYAYSLNGAAKDDVGRGMLLRVAIRERAPTLGYEVKALYTVKGASGVEHSFDMALLSKDGNMVIDTILSDKPITQIEIIKEYTKQIDTGEHLHLIAIPSVAEDAKKLAEFYKINLVEAASSQEALETLFKELGAGKEAAPEKPKIGETQRQQDEEGPAKGLRGAFGFRRKK